MDPTSAPLMKTRSAGTVVRSPQEARASAASHAAAGRSRENKGRIRKKTGGTRHHGTDRARGNGRGTAGRFYGLRETLTGIGEIPTFRKIFTDGPGFSLNQ